MESQLFDSQYESATQRQLRKLIANKLIKYEQLNQDKNEKPYLVIPKKKLPHQLTAYDVIYVANYLNVGLILQGDELRIYFNEKPEQFVDDYRIDKTFKFQSQLEAYRLCEKVAHTIQWAINIVGILLLCFVAIAILDGRSYIASNIALCIGLLLFFSVVNLGFAKLTQKRILRKLRKVLEKNKLT